MHLNITPEGILQFDDVKIAFRNFEGRGDDFNREGDRNFVVVIDDQEIADVLIEEGWNVKIKPPRVEGEEPFMFLKVKVKFGGFREPNINLISGNARVRLTEDTVGCLDDADILHVDLDVRPYNWEKGSKSGRTAYLQGAHIEQRVDRFTARYMED